MTADDLRGRIRDLGGRFDFGEYELDAYLAVLEAGELTATELAERTDVPQTRVYDTVRSLEGRGVVELREGRPMRVVAVDPERAFDAFQSTVEDVLDGLESRYVTPSWGAEAVTLVRSRDSIDRYLGDVVASAEHDLSVALTPRLLRQFADDLAERVDSGVTVELIVTPAADAPDPAAFDYGRVATRARTRRGVTTPIVAVADGTYSVYTTQADVDDCDTRYGVIFSQSMLGFLLFGFYSTILWTTAEHVHRTDRTVSFPRRYSSIRRAIHAIEESGAAVTATVEGRDVLTGAPRRVSGRVVDAHTGPGEQVARITVETDDGAVTVGGRVAAFEDVEAHRIRLAVDDRC